MSNQNVRWSSTPSRPLLNSTEQKFIDNSNFSPTISSSPKRQNRSRGVIGVSSPLVSWPENLRPAPADFSGTRLVFGSKGIIGRKFSPSVSQDIQLKREEEEDDEDELTEEKKAERKAERKIEDRRITALRDKRNLTFSDYYQPINPSDFLSTSYTTESKASPNRPLPPQWTSTPEPTPVEAARLSREDASRRLTITGGREAESKKKFTYPSLAYLKDGEMVSILYGSTGQLYLLSHLTGAPRSVRGRNGPPIAPLSETRVIMNPIEAYNINFSDFPIYLVKGNTNTILTKQKIDDMTSNSMITDLETIYGSENINYPQYIESVRTQGLGQTRVFDDIIKQYFFE